MTNAEIREKVVKLTKVTKFSEDMDGAEMQDVVDNEGIVVGSLPRGVIWDNGLESYTRVINVFLLDKDERVLVQVRSLKKKNWPGGYDFSCGENLKSGESYNEAVRRGLVEELGLYDIEVLESAEFRPDPEKGLVCFGKVYTAVIDKDQKLVFDRNEVQEFVWKTKSEIKKLFQAEPEKFKRDYRAVFELVFGVEP